MSNAYSASPADERPQTMMWFDQLFLASIALSLATIIWSLPILDDLLSRDAKAGLPASMGGLFALLVGTFLGLMCLWFCISRLRSKIARGILVIFVGNFFVNSLGNLSAALAFGPIVFAMSFGNVALSVGAVACLLTPSARTWFLAKSR
jgi:hypothetical protein